MLEHSQRPEVGAVGARLLFPNGTLQHAGVVLGIQGKSRAAVPGLPRRSSRLLRLRARHSELQRGHRRLPDDAESCVRRSERLRRQTFDVSYNDVDLCLRLSKRGYLVVYTPYAVLYHHQSASRGRVRSGKGSQIRRATPRALAADPRRRRSLLQSQPHIDTLRLFSSRLIGTIGTPPGHRWSSLAEIIERWESPTGAGRFQRRAAPQCESAPAHLCDLHSFEFSGRSTVPTHRHPVPLGIE